jgi:hypothetical protein
LISNRRLSNLEDDAAIDPAGFARLVSIQRLHPRKTTFVHVDPGNQKLVLIDGPRSRVLVPSRPPATYDPKATAAQITGPDEVIVSLTVDPLNPAAVARKKRDRPELELYAASRSGGTMSRLLVMDTGHRPTAWQVAAGKLALLRQHRVFSRGGTGLDVYSLPAERVTTNKR